MTEHILNQIKSTIDSRSEEIERFALELVKESSETPPGDERAVAGLITDQALLWGLPEPRVLAKAANRPNLIFALRGRKKGRSLALNGHMDTKPIGDASKWTVDPGKPRIINGRLYGRGSTDMKGAIAGMLAAAMAIVKNDIYFGGELILALTADEEGGGSFGISVLIDEGFRPDAMIIAEPSGEEKDFDCIGLACRGGILGKVVVHGTQMHSSLSDRGGCINASVKMAEVMVEFHQNLKKHLRYNPHPLYPNGPTVNPGVLLDGGVFYGVIPGIASFGFDLRIIPGMVYEEVVEDIHNFLKLLMQKDKELKAELMLEEPSIRWAPPVEISADNPLAVSCKDATREIRKTEPRLVGVPFGTDGIFFVKAGIEIDIVPSFGPGLIKLAHGPDEFVNVRSIPDSAKIFAITAIDYLNK